MQSLAENNSAVFYHGSPFGGLTVIEPRPANDANGDDFNTDLAVFASAHQALAIIFALVDRSALPLDAQSNTWSVKGKMCSGALLVTAHIPLAWRAHIENNARGYLYLLPTVSFGDNDGLQWKSKTAVVPHAVEVVTLSDYLAAGGMIEWT